VELRDIARSVRRRQVGEALDFERDREAALRGQLEETAAELEGPRIDEETFAAMDPDDIGIVQQALLETGDVFEDGLDADADGEWLQEFMDGGSPEDARKERLEEVARLEEEIADSRRRQQALERYLEALGAAKT
jgi:hypothetical protein